MLATSPAPSAVASGFSPKAAAARKSGRKHAIAKNLMVGMWKSYGRRADDSSVMLILLLGIFLWSGEQQFSPSRKRTPT